MKITTDAIIWKREKAHKGKNHLEENIPRLEAQ